MDNFLQLVPMEADADSDSALVYGEEDDIVVHDNEEHETLDESMAATTAAQFFDPLTHFAAAPASAGLHSDELHERNDSDAAETPAHQRAVFLEKIVAMEKLMLAAQADVDRRLDAVRRVRAVRDPTQQFMEYLPLLVEQSSESQHHSIASTSEGHAEDQQAHDRTGTVSADDDEVARLTAELLECARQMSDPHDAEVALLAAFVFACDAPRSSRYQRRNPNSIVPAIAALLEASSDGLESHTQQHHSF